MINYCVFLFFPKREYGLTSTENEVDIEETVTDVGTTEHPSDFEYKPEKNLGQLLSHENVWVAYNIVSRI